MLIGFREIKECFRKNKLPSVLFVVVAWRLMSLVSLNCPDLSGKLSFDPIILYHEGNTQMLINSFDSQTETLV